MTSGTYFIGVPIGNGSEHMTLKYLGQLSEEEVRGWARQLDQLGTKVTKFPVKSLGVGLLGKTKPFLVDFIQKTPRAAKALDFLGDTKRTLHVTNHSVPDFSPNEATNTGPMNANVNTLAEEVHLYRVRGHRDYESVYAVQLRRRTPVAWLADKFGLGKYAESNMNKEAGFKDIVTWPGNRIGMALHKAKIRNDVQALAAEAKELGLKDPKAIRQFVNNKMRSKVNIADLSAHMKSSKRIGHALTGIGAVGTVGTAGYLGYKSLTKEGFHKTSSAAPLLESLIGAGVGGYTAYKASNDKPWAAITGAVAGGVAGPWAGSKLRSRAVQSVDKSINDMSNKYRALRTNARSDFHQAHREFKATGKVENVPGLGMLKNTDDIYTNAVAAPVNSMIASLHAKPILRETAEKSREMAQNMPFGVGGLIGSANIGRKSSTYLKPYKNSGLKLEEDLNKATIGQKRTILEYLRRNSAATQADSDRVINHLTRAYIH